MFSKKQQDLKIGFSNEDLVYEKLKTIPYCSDLKKISGYSIIDFKGSEADLELKSRPTINHDKWATAIIGCNKINDFRNNKKSHNYVCWLYQDGLYYIKVDLNNWNFTKGVQKVERDGKVEFSDCYYIPYQNLIKVE
jgi:hypothetical protein